MFRKLAVALALLLATLSFRVYALGLGEIEMLSALNQPMSADIGLISTTDVDLSEVKITLASRSAHERLGLSRAKILSDFKFAITEDSRGRAIVHISSTELVREPYLEFLLEMVWEYGQMIREYTVLVDPPVTMQAAPVVSVAPVVNAPKPAPAVARPVKMLQPVVVKKPAPAVVKPPPVANKAAKNYGPIRREETLWSIADRLRPSGEISIQQMMIALQKTNPEAFGDSNINNLKANVTLKIPDKTTILALNDAQARAEAGRQYKQWRDKRNAAKALVKKPATKETVRQEIAGTEAQLKLTPAESEAVPESESASGSETDTPDSGAAGVENASQQLALASEEIEAGRAESRELHSRVQELEEQIAKMQRLLELKSEELAGMQNRPSESETEPPASEALPVEKEDSSSGSEAVVVTESGEVSGEDSSDTEPRGIVNRLMDNPVLAGLGVLVAMVLGGFLWGSMRKQANQDMFDGERLPHDKTLTDLAEEEPSSAKATLTIRDPGEFDEGATDDQATHAPGGVNDPVSEADVYLAYGRIQQAEDVLQAALQDNPESMAIRAKLLRVYHAAGKVAAFNSAASVYRESVSDDDRQWQKIAALGNELSPGNELYRSALTMSDEQEDAVEFDMDLSGLDDMSSGDSGNGNIQNLDISDETGEAGMLPENLDFTLDDEDDGADEAEGLLANEDEIATKLDLARAYLDMDDPEGARSILQEVIEEGNEEQKSEAQSLISKIA